MKIKGEISFKGKARIDGQIDGNIDGEHLVLSESGVITGDINASSFICQGKVEGNIKAYEKGAVIARTELAVISQ